MRYNFITIEGNIGAGKTTLAKMMAERFNGHLILEQFADNPFLPSFYKNPDSVAFPLEMFFVAERYQQLEKMLAAPDIFKKLTVSDYLFIKSLLFASVNLKGNELNLFKRLFHIIYKQLPRPDLVLYLHAPVDRLLDNIHKRGREYERDITADYLSNIQERYFNYFRTQYNSRILILDISEIDFVATPSHFNHIVALINKDYKPGTHFLKV